MSDEFQTLAMPISVTRLGGLLDFGQLFKAFGNNLICQNLPHSQAIYVKVSKSLIFLVKSFLGHFYRHLATFYTGNTDANQKQYF